MPPITARVAAELNQADRSVPVAVRIAGAGADPQAVGALLLRGRDGAVTPLSAVAKITTGLGAQPRSITRTACAARSSWPSPKGADQAGYRRGGAQGDCRESAAAAGRVTCAMAARPRRRPPRRDELLLHSAAAFVLIVLLLALAFGHARHVLLVLLSLPSTLIGGVAAVASPAAP